MHDIPFRSPSSDSDFSCKDGELLSAVNIGNDILFPNRPFDSKAPVPDINFALVREVLPGWHIISDSYPAKTLVASEPSMDYWNHLGAQLLSRFQSEALQHNLFVASFYTMAVWKTYSGQYLSPSTPVLLVPNSKVPPVATDGDVSSPELEMKIAGAVCALYFKMEAPEVLRDWVGIIQSLEIFVSKPLQSYDTYHSFVPSRHVTSDNVCRSLDLQTGEISDRRICTETLSLAWSAILSPPQIPACGSTTPFYRYASVPLGEVDIKDSWSRAESSSYLTSGIESLNLEAITTGMNSAPGPIIIHGDDKEMEIMTRPMKLTGGDLKSVTRVHLRGNYTPGNLGISVYGSRDMLGWWLVSERRGGTVVALPAARFRYLKVRISGYLSRSETLEGLTIEQRA